MLISIDNEATRLKTKGPFLEEFCPFVVTIFRDSRSRSPIMVRRKTLQEACGFVEDVTSLYAHKWVRTTDEGRAATIYAFTGKHQERYADVKQYKPADLVSFAEIKHQQEG